MCPKVRCPRVLLLAFKEAWKDRSTGRSHPGDAPRRIQCDLADRGQGAVCPGGFRLWPQEGYWNHGEVRLRFDAYNVVAPPTTCLVPVVHRTRPRCVVAVRHLSVVEVVESQTALPTTERLAITGAAMHTQV